MPPYTIHPTPNPDSLKFASEGEPFIETGLATYSSADQAAGDPLASELFTIDGIVDILILPTFLTITKRPQVDWNVVLPAIERVLTKHLGA